MSAVRWGVWKVAEYQVCQKIVKIEIYGRLTTGRHYVSLPSKYS